MNITRYFKISDAMMPGELLVIGGHQLQTETLQEFAKRCCWLIKNVGESLGTEASVSPAEQPQ